MGINASCNRKIDYLRISITDRCNFRCRYCMPPEGVEYKEHDKIMRYEEIERFVKIALAAGIKKIRITGGEPLVRKGVLSLLENISTLPGLKELSMTSNGFYLKDKAPELKQAGLDRINISLDTLKPSRFNKITRVAGLSEVIAGIEAAKKVNLNPVKLNVVIIRDFNDDEVLDFVEFSQQKAIQVRFIELMPLNGESKDKKDQYISTTEIKTIIEEAGHKLKPIEMTGSGPAQNYQLAGSQGKIGFISPLSHNFCDSCNRLRLTADGYLKPCLAGNNEIKLYDEEGNLYPDNILAQKLAEASSLKPSSHRLTREQKLARNMSQIGG